MDEGLRGACTRRLIDAGFGDNCPNACALAAHEYARRSGVERELLAEWQPHVDEARVARKAWRWVGEMEEIARAFADEDLPPGFHEAAAEIYRAIGRPTVSGSVNDGGSSE